MCPGGNPPPGGGDKPPGQWKVEMFHDDKSLLAILEKAEHEGYELKGMNDRLVALYKELD